MLTKVFVIILLTFSPMNSNAEIFYPLINLKPKEEKKEVKKEETFNLPKLQIKAIVISKKGKLALINDQYLKEGDTIENCTLKKIVSKPPSAILECDGVKIELKTQLVNPNSQEDLE